MCVHVCAWDGSCHVFVCACVCEAAAATRASVEEKAARSSWAPECLAMALPVSFCKTDRQQKVLCCMSFLIHQLLRLPPPFET